MRAHGALLGHQHGRAVPQPPRQAHILKLRQLLLQEIQERLEALLLVFLDLLAGQLAFVDRLQLLALAFGQRLGDELVDGIGQEKHFLPLGLERLQQG